MGGLRPTPGLGAASVSSGDCRRARPAALTAKVARSAAVARVFDMVGGSRAIVCSSGAAVELCSVAAAAAALSGLYEAGELSATQLDAAVGLLADWAGTVGELADAARVLARP
jgi:hypothetical protein